MSFVTEAAPTDTGNTLPAGWTRTTIGQVCSKPQYGWTTKAASTGTVRLLRTTDISSGRLNWETVPYCTDVPPALQSLQLEEGDIVVSRAGSVGLSFLIQVVPNVAVFASYLIRFRPTDAVERKYLSLFMKSREYWDAISEVSAGIALANVNATKLEAISLPLAPLTEQSRIVSRIEELTSQIDAGVSGLRDVQKKLKRYRAAVLKAACEGTLVPTEADLAARENRPYEPATDLLARILTERRARWEAEQLEKMRAAGKTPKDDAWKARYVEPAAPDMSGLPELPEGWTWTSVAQLGEVTTGFTPSTREPRFFGGGIPFLKPTDLAAGYNVREGRETLTEAGAKQGRLLATNAVLVTCIGATIGKAGMARVPSTTNQQINAVETTLLPLSQWLYWFLVSPFGKRQIVENASATTLPILNKSKFCQVCVPLPPLAEQERIVAEVELRLSVIDQMEAALSANLKRADRLRQAILRDAFAGKLVPQDPSDEPASVLLERIKAEREQAAAAQARPTRKKETPSNGRRDQNDTAGKAVPRRKHQGKRNPENPARVQSDLFSADGI